MGRTRKDGSQQELPSAKLEPQQKTLRHLTSINDFGLSEIELIFDLAERYLHKLRDPVIDYRIADSTDVARGKILATLFYEPSTRTRLSFESAMARLGGKSISSADPATSSAAKGESLADTVRVVSNYADAIVIRHPRDGAARFAAEFSGIPIVNGGDGAHEHPTQTLCDLFTLRRENKNLKNMNVAIQGDLKGSRTIHSFVYALARFGAHITLMPARGMELPEHVFWRLQHELKRGRGRERKSPENELDALYVTGDEPHQLHLIPPSEIINIEMHTSGRRERKRIDAVYVTRFQKERSRDKAHDYPTVDAKFLRAKRFSHTRVMHPLPRVGELDVALDSDPRAIYFQQAAYGVPIRMALLSALLNLDNAGIEHFVSGFRGPRHVVYDRPANRGIRCLNSNCIVHDELDAKYASNKFYIIDVSPPRLRCFYCETDIETFIAADERLRTYDPAPVRTIPPNIDEVVFFAGESEARAFLSKRQNKIASA